jgi:hypothetical protein
MDIGEGEECSSKKDLTHIFTCKFIIHIALTVICVLGSKGYSQQQSATASAEVKVESTTIFLIDATDTGWDLAGNETIDIGNVDGRGTAISGAPTGNPGLNGIAGIPVDAAGSPLPHPNNPDCIGAFYPFFSADGGNSDYRHPNSAVAIFLLTFNQWRISTSARLLSSTPNVTVNQLKWKMDETPAKGFQNYIDFTTSEHVVASGSGSWGFIYLDYGLLVEHEDEPGPNVWLITYTLITE